MPSNQLPSSFPDDLLTAADTALRTLFAPPRSARPMPRTMQSASDAARPRELSTEEKRLSAALMRVNHVGEVCAQALYTAQALTTPDPALRRHFMRACNEETDHLAWTKQRLDELGSRTSLLNPLWYAGAFGIGLLAGRMGNAISLGFVVETEHQVEAHLDSHLERLPAGDTASRAIVAQMSKDEAGHASEALDAGGEELPGPVKGLMRAAAKVMTTTAHYV
ncbi:2-polyprenyl-3-methyl-6-methoxy-1,4-benzoquinone monooxygenase [Hylemonella gracilis]|uniref:2-polyprenyl-3-methyl-6-methoxy-1,4-benzoquinone monooxygenase n=1 Tax=Hylemonella gracilis TaxID=80880 RepID=UPI000553E35B|nr:2-polyprenyl-3-methyl-6-methoxy-1,4-benzoquinone monooxygenase [Hylemonella gracilis]